MNPIQELITRYQYLLSSNPINPYYKSKDEYKKEIISKIQELKGKMK